MLYMPSICPASPIYSVDIGVKLAPNSLEPSRNSLGANHLSESIAVLVLVFVIDLVGIEPILVHLRVALMTEPVSEPSPMQ